jgi:hypothetical protein
MIILRVYWRTKCVSLRRPVASERAALPPRTGRRRRPGVRARPLEEASPLRDSAGISPASLGQHLPRDSGPGRAQPIAGARSLRATGKLRTARARELPGRGTATAPPSHTWRGLRLLSRGKADHLRSDTPAGSAVNKDARAVPERVTPCAIGTDEQADAGGVGTPELTSPRLQVPAVPGRWCAVAPAPGSVCI